MQGYLLYRSCVHMGGGRHGNVQLDTNEPFHKRSRKVSPRLQINLKHQAVLKFTPETLRITSRVDIVLSGPGVISPRQCKAANQDEQREARCQSPIFIIEDVVFAIFKLVCG